MSLATIVHRTSWWPARELGPLLSLRVRHLEGELDSRVLREVLIRRTDLAIDPRDIEVADGIARWYPRRPARLLDRDLNLVAEIANRNSTFHSEPVWLGRRCRRPDYYDPMLRRWLYML